MGSLPHSNGLSFSGLVALGPISTARAVNRPQNPMASTIASPAGMYAWSCKARRVYGSRRNGQRTRDGFSVSDRALISDGEAPARAVRDGARSQVRLGVAQRFLERKHHLFAGVDQVDRLGVGPAMRADLLDDGAGRLVERHLAEVGADPRHRDDLEVVAVGGDQRRARRSPDVLGAALPPPPLHP